MSEAIPHARRSPARRRTVAGAIAGVATAVAAVALTAVAGPAGAATGVGSGYWHTSGSRILDANNNPVRIAGINWYGFETSDEVVHGLWSQDYKSVVDTIKNLGYNTIRLPFSNQMVEAPKVPNNISFYGSTGPINTDLKGLTALQIMDKIISYAGQDGLKVILDDHRSEDGNSAEQNGLWYTSAYPESAWINDWVAMVNRYKNDPTVIGADLRNEPHTQSYSSYGTGSTWGTGAATDWQLGAQRGGNAVLAANPNLLVFVEGISDWVNDSGTTVSDWWGGDLQAVATHPVTLSVGNRLVYSAHDYGPHEYAQSWFNSSTTYASLSAVWDKNWGYIAKQGTAPILVGEFGTPNGATDVSDSTAGSQGQWFSSMVQYLKSNNLSWTYWALNGEDAYGLLDNQYSSAPVSAAKQAALAGIQFPLGGGPSNPGSPSATGSRPASASPSPSTPVSASPSSAVSASPSSGTGGGSCRVAYAKQSEWSTGFVAQVTITNTGTAAVNGWSLAFTFPGDQKITNAWSATVSQSGSAVTATGAGFNATIAAGGTASFGFQGSYATSDASPTAFTLNGTTCAAG